jgi:NAD(P)-dependent dehydrogenase (short-subunit alcohol dehydrogenase family)
MCELQRRKWTSSSPTAGFIGSALKRQLFARGGAHVRVADKLTSAANLASLQAVAASPRFSFIKADICDAAALRDAFARAWARSRHAPRGVSGAIRKWPLAGAGPLRPNVPTPDGARRLTGQRVFAICSLRHQGVPCDLTLLITTGVSAS